MREEIWTSAVALREKTTLDRHYGRFYAAMPSHQHHPHRSAAATLLLDKPHDSWKERYAPDPWIDQTLLPRKALSFTVSEETYHRILNYIRHSTSR
jgi:hypothetical protein